MLTKVILENFKSYKSRTEFDLEATKYQVLQDTNVKDGILKGALIVGPNASGKSNLILAVKTLLDMLFADNFGINFEYGCLFGSGNLISLEYHFKFGKNAVKYHFDTDYDGNVIYELLAVGGKTVLERKGKSGKILISGGEQVMDGKFTDNVLLLRKSYFSDMFSENTVVIKLMSFLRNSAYIDVGNKVAISYNGKSRLIAESEQGTINDINELFNEMGLGFAVSKESEKSVSEIDENGQKVAFVVKADKPIVFFKRNDMDLMLPLQMESSGNQALAHMILSAYYCCKENSLLLINEFSSGFHNKLEESFIKYLFTHFDRSQIIFTSHSTNLLNTRLIRPDQIYAVDFTANEGSKISRFSDENPREAQNIEKMYLSGKFGAIPVYNI